MRSTFAIAAIVLASCASEGNVVDLPGARNDAFRAAAHAHGLPEDWLMAVGYQQGRFEPAEMTSPDEAMPAVDPADAPWVLDQDTAIDETDAAPTGPVEPAIGDDVDGNDPELAIAAGVMYLTPEQVDRAVALTGGDAEAIRSNIAANIEAGAALIADGWDGTTDGLRARTAAFLDADDTPETTELALSELDDIIANGFDVTTSDGERLALRGTDPVEQAAERTLPGHYPPFTWIPSPNFSSRLGYPIRFVVIHDIEGTMPGAISIFKKSSSQVSAHYIVRSHDGHIVKMVHETQNAWHAGHGWFNRHSIGIEHEGFAFRRNGGGYYTDTLYGASAKLTCAIAHRYHIPVDRKHIFGHMNVPSSLSSHTLCSDKRGIAGKCGGVSHHADPGRYWNWPKYMKLVAGCVHAAS
jgi:N-acetyl-anhydromuramyl-L-alanine amidase AmpD